MPLYALIYLFLFFLFAFGSTYMHFEEGRASKFVFAEAASYSFLISFLVFYYESTEIQINSLIVLAMMVFSVSWEVYSFKEDAKTAKKDFGIKDRELMVYTAVGAVFMLPVYLAGLALIF